MTLKDWLNLQGFPHGMECVGEARLQQLWDAAQTEAIMGHMTNVQKTTLWLGALRYYMGRMTYAVSESGRKNPNADTTRFDGRN